MAMIPVLLIAVIVSGILLALHNKREEKREKLKTGYSDTIEYIQMDNYVRAGECCEDALELAEDLGEEQMQQELSGYQKLIEAVLAAEEQLDNEEYADAQNSYQDAAKRARYVDNLGLSYINDRLELTADYLSVYDYIYLGDTLALNLQYDAAEEKYLDAKALASKIYFDKGRTLAIDALEKLYEDEKEIREAENEAREEQLTQEESAANYMSQGDAAFAKEDYESAKVYYTSALQKYEELEDEAQQSAASDKLAVTESKISAGSDKRAEAEGYMAQASDAMNVGDYTSAGKYYLLAKDIYAGLKDDDKLGEIDRKLEVLQMKESEQQAAQGAVW